MSISSNIRAGAAYVEVTTNNSKLRQILSDSQARLKAFGDACTKVGKDLLWVAGAAAVPLITGGRVKATVLYNRKSEFDLNVSGAGVDLFNSCYKLTGYNNGSYEYNYGRFYTNGAGYYIYEVDIDRNIPTAGPYQYVIKAWVITTRLTWQENLGPGFLGESANTYKIINTFEQWEGSTKIGEISATQKYAGSGMGSMPDLRIINQ